MIDLKKANGNDRISHAPCVKHRAEKAAHNEKNKRKEWLMLQGYEGVASLFDCFIETQKNV
ncbi:hypothetical protein [Terasakiella sp. SH-1]|uniref:hypothetical protein n=1 Tax=Terasakiella sp. SH-1 TaxID=2560057 RepID=UPI0010743E99|nr:hypothetical protein [Terasakiella sp. SH-1]